MDMNDDHEIIVGGTIDSNTMAPDDADTYPRPDPYFIFYNSMGDVKWTKYIKGN